MDYVALGRMLNAARAQSIDPKHNERISEVAQMFSSAMSRCEEFNWQQRDAFLVAAGNREPGWMDKV